MKSAETSKFGLAARPTPARCEPVRPAARWLHSLAETHGERCIAYLRRKYGPGPPDPEDCAQQALAQLAQLDWAFIEKITSPKSFLFRAAENALISQKRREATRKRHVLESKAGIAPDDFARGGWDCDPERVLVTREELSVIEKTINAMPRRRRQCFAMHRFEELSLAEIARRLRLSETTVRDHVESGLKDVKKAIDAMDQGEPL